MWVRNVGKRPDAEVSALETITAHFSGRLDEGQHLINTDHETPVQQELPFPEPRGATIHAHASAQVTASSPRTFSGTLTFPATLRNAVL